MCNEENLCKFCFDGAGKKELRSTKRINKTSRGDERAECEASDHERNEMHADACKSPITNTFEEAADDGKQEYPTAPDPAKD